MFRNFLNRLSSSLRMSPTRLGGLTKQEIDQIKANADAELTRFSGETTQFCLKKIRGAKA